jgi:hypothetical protein
MRSPTTVATFKIGTNKGRPRLWIDGQRLLAAGFKPGATYTLHRGQGTLWLDTSPDWAPAHPPVPAETRRVSGRPGGKPIIDILGRTLEAAFDPMPARVRVTFTDGRIVVQPDA